MRYQGRLVEGTFLSRENRFLGTIRVRGEEAGCYVPNSGRLLELLRPGTPVWARESPSGERKTRWDLALAAHGDILVSVDTRAVNRLVPEAIRSGVIPSLRGLEIMRAEYPFLDSRLDFLARDQAGPVLLEAKSCTLVEDGLALFPDAPTSRGSRHLEALAAAAQGGKGALVAIVVQREDASAFSPNDATDPAFGKAFRQALASGVRACAFTCRVGTRVITPYREIPVVCP